MPRLTIADSLGNQLIETRRADGYTVDELRRFAAIEAGIQAAMHGRVLWRIADDRGRELAAGVADAPPRPGLLAVGTPVLYAESDPDAAGLLVYGSIGAVRSGHYLVTVDHVDSGGRPVPIGVMAELRVPVDTPPHGAPRTLEAMPLASQVAAE